MTQECWFGKFGQYPLIVHSGQRNPADIRLSIRLSWTKLTGEQVEAINKELKQCHASLEIGSVDILLGKKRLTGTDHIDKLLGEVAAFLEKEGFMPEAKIDFDNLYL